RDRLVDQPRRETVSPTPSPRSSTGAHRLIAEPLVQRAMELTDHFGGVRSHLDGTIGVLRRLGQSPLMVPRLELGELEPMGRRHDDGPLVGLDDAALYELLQARERNACMRTVEHARAISTSHSIGELGLA